MTEEKGRIAIHYVRVEHKIVSNNFHRIVEYLRFCFQQMKVSENLSISPILFENAEKSILFLLPNKQLCEGKWITFTPLSFVSSKETKSLEKEAALLLLGVLKF